MDIVYPDKYFKAVEFVEKTYGDIEASSELDNVQKLVMYALRKQVEVGPCNEPAPYMWNVKEKYKHDAWMQLKKMSKFEAMVHYVQHLEEIQPQWLVSMLPPPPAESPPVDLDVDLHNVELSQASVNRLVDEVKRLRGILRKNGVPFDMVSLNPASTEAAESGADRVEQQHSETSEEHTAIPPIKPLVGADAVVPPVRPLAPIASQAQRGNVSEQQHQEPVYYRPKKLSWLEWLGLVSVDEVADGD